MTFDEVYENYYEVIYKTVYMSLLNRENTEDVVQEAFIKAMNSWDSFDESKASVKTWLLKIARNTMLNYIRDNRRRAAASFDEMNENGFDVGEEDKELSLLTDGYASQAYVILRALNSSDRELLSMRFAEELSYKEIALRIGSNEKAVAKRMERLLKKCAQIRED